MIPFSPSKAFVVAVVGLAALTGLTGCHMGGGNTASNTAGPRFSEPSGGGAAIAAERPGAGVGAQSGMGAAVDVPEATQKGAGASDLTKPGETASNRGQGQAAGTAATPSASPITDVQTLTAAADPNEVTGRQAQLSGVKVQQVHGQHLLVVSDRNGYPLYVRVEQPVQNLNPGDTVNLSGTVQRVPSSPSELGLSPQATQALQGQSIYLDAQQVQPANQ